jgi:hypothetical protein
MIRKVYEVDPMVCPKCKGSMMVVPVISACNAGDRIIGYPKLTFVVEKPLPSPVFEEIARSAAKVGPE